jgi:glycosyltransferase involved in cell wall biosynthesis
MIANTLATRKPPLFSVVIPTHNRAELLARAVKSVLAQTQPNFELIIVDDASSDNTTSVVSAIQDERVRYMRHEKGRGGAAARNSGIREACGEYVAFLDDDDEWMADKLEKQGELFARHTDPDLGVVVCGSRVLKGSSVTDMIPRPRGWVFEEILAFQRHTTTSTLLVRKSCLDHVGVFDESFPTFDEWDLLLRLSKEYTFDYVDQPLHVYYEHEGERLSNPKNEIRAMHIILDKYAEELQARPEISALHHYKLARMYIRTGDLRAARAQIAASLRKSPRNPRLWLLYMMTSLDANAFGKFYHQYTNLSRIKHSFHKG